MSTLLIMYLTIVQYPVIQRHCFVVLCLESAKKLTATAQTYYGETSSEVPQALIIFYTSKKVSETKRMT